MTLVSESVNVRFYFSILGGTHLLISRLAASGNGVISEVLVRELGKLSGGATLTLALASVHEALPRIRIALFEVFAERIAHLCFEERNPLGPLLAMEFGRLCESREDVPKQIAFVQIACEVRNILDGELDEWTKALTDTNDDSKASVLGSTLIYREADTFDCMVRIARVHPTSILKNALISAELCVLVVNYPRPDIVRAVQLSTQWAKQKIEVCAADVRWRSFWRAVKRNRNELQPFSLEEDDMIGEEARVSLTMIDSRFDDLLGCIEQGVSWLGPLQRTLAQAGWLVAQVRLKAGAPSGLLVTRDDCCPRFAVFAASEMTSAVFDLLFKYDTDVRSFPPELQDMLSWLLRFIGGIFLDACVARVGSTFLSVGLETVVTGNELEDSDTEDEPPPADVDYDSY